MRISEGNSVTHQVKSIEKSDQVVFNLKIKGSMPELKGPPKDPTLGFLVLNTEEM